MFTFKAEACGFEHLIITLKYTGWRWKGKIYMKLLQDHEMNLHNIN